jgi:hypothetical protein
LDFKIVIIAKFSTVRVFPFAKIFLEQDKRVLALPYRGRRSKSLTSDLHSARYIISSDFYTIVLYTIFTSCLKARTLIMNDIFMGLLREGKERVEGGGMEDRGER